jgi:hypothetical protein
MSPNSSETKVNKLEETVKSQASLIKKLESQVTHLQDVQEIEKIQRIYGFYLDHWMTQEILDLFSDSDECELDWMEGIWKGKKGVERYFRSVRAAVPDPRFMHMLMQTNGVIDVSTDGKRAKGRFYGFGGMLAPRGNEVSHSLACGIYENEYIKEDGVWKILKFSWTAPFSIRFPAESWQSPEERAGGLLSGPPRHEPDVPYTAEQRWVTGYIRPFHYKHPITGKATSEKEHNAKLTKFQAKNT